MATQLVDRTMNTNWPNRAITYTAGDFKVTLHRNTTWKPWHQRTPAKTKITLSPLGEHDNLPPVSYDDPDFEKKMRIETRIINERRLDLFKRAADLVRQTEAAEVVDQKLRYNPYGCGSGKCRCSPVHVAQTVVTADFGQGPEPVDWIFISDK